VIKRLYDESGQRLSEQWRDEVKNYLKLNSKYFEKTSLPMAWLRPTTARPQEFYEPGT